MFIWASPLFICDSAEIGFSLCVSVATSPFAMNVSLFVLIGKPTEWRKLFEKYVCFPSHN